MNQEDYNTCIREIFSILTQGIEVTMYETNIVTKRSSVRKQTIWMVNLHPPLKNLDDISTNFYFMC